MSSPAAAALGSHRQHGKPSLLQQSIDGSAKQLYKELQQQASELYGRHISENRDHVVASRQDAMRAKLQAHTAKVERTLVERLAHAEAEVDSVERAASDKLRRALEEKLGRLASTQYYARANRVYHAAKVGAHRKELEAAGKLTLKSLLEKSHLTSDKSSVVSQGVSRPATVDVDAQMLAERRRSAELMAMQTRRETLDQQQQRAAVNRSSNVSPPRPPRSSAGGPGMVGGRPVKVGDPRDLDWGSSPTSGAGDQDAPQQHAIRPSSSGTTPTATKATPYSNVSSRATSSHGMRSRLALPPLPYLADHHSKHDELLPDPFPEAAVRAASAVQEHRSKSRTPNTGSRPRSQQKMISTALQKILAVDAAKKASPSRKRTVSSAMARSSTGGYAPPPPSSASRRFVDRLASSRAQEQLHGAKRLAAEWIGEFGASKKGSDEEQDASQVVRVSISSSSAARQALLARENLNRPAAPADGRRRYDASGQRGELALSGKHQSDERPVNLEDFFLGEFESPPRQNHQHQHQHRHHRAEDNEDTMRPTDGNGRQDVPHRGKQQQQQQQDDEDDPFPMPMEGDPNFESSTSDDDDDEYDDDDDDEAMSSMSTPRLPSITTPPTSSLAQPTTTSDNENGCAEGGAANAEQPPPSPDAGGDDCYCDESGLSPQRHTLAHNIVVVAVGTCLGEV